MKIRTGDTVLVIAGKDRGKTGTVLRVLPLKNRIVVEGINMRVRHIRKTLQQPGQRIRYEASIAASNLMILDPKTKKPTRIGYKVDPKTGVKQRIAKVSGEVLKGSASAKPTGAAAKAKSEKQGDKETPAKDVKTEKKADKKADAAGMPPGKKPFWKRAFNAESPDNTGVSEDKAETAERAHAPTVHRSNRES
jgi:large subunit ribosomal protein L24